MRVKDIAKTSLVTITIVFTSACAKTSPSSSVSQTNEEPSASPTATRSPLTGFQADLQYVRNGAYTYIWVFSRKDGKPLDKDDGAFLRKNAAQIVDWVTTEQGKKVIGGTNFDLEKGNLDVLRKRFVVEDYSGK